MTDCWICGARADSAEHKIKRSDLKRLYGRGPFHGADGVLHVVGGETHPLQGPRADAIKHATSLCAGCNGARTQPFDQAYDRLLSWVLSNETQLLRERTIDLAAALGSDWQASQWNLLRYFAKGLGCQLRDVDIPVPRDLVELVLGATSIQDFSVSFAISEAFLRLTGDIRYAGIGSLIVRRRVRTGELTGYHSSRQYGWLHIGIWYRHWPHASTDWRWSCDGQVVPLGTVDP